jgi:hypothetical protein
MKQPSYKCSCILCKKETSSLGIATHFMRTHGTSEQKQLFKNSAIVAKNKQISNEQKYLLNPVLCKECNSPLPYVSRHFKFCSHSCSAINSNSNRAKQGWSMPADARQAISNKLSLVQGAYTKITHNTCKFCNQIFTTPKTHNQVCKHCQHLKWNNNKDQYSFKFNVYSYPELFNLELLTQVGWVSFGGKRGGTKNPTGLSRDHRVSVNEAKRFNYDPYYISHPCNCELITHIENMKKKTKSSISYEELVILVNKFDGLNDQTCTG